MAPDPVQQATEADVPRIGLILLSTDLTTERDAARLIGPAEAGLHATRVQYDNPTTIENLRKLGPRLAGAAALLIPGAPLAAILFSCTSGTVALGEDAVRDAIGSARPGVPVVTPTEAARAALASLGARRIALFTPYIAEATDAMAAHFGGLGFEVVRRQGMGLEDDRDMARVPQDDIVAAAIAADTPEAEAFFISCTALPALSTVARVEAALGKPVVTSNQATLWRLRRLAGLTSRISGYGRLFGLDPVESAA